MIVASMFRLKFSTFILNINPLYCHRQKHVEKKNMKGKNLQNMKL